VWSDATFGSKLAPAPSGIGKTVRNPVDRVEREQQRDLQARLFDGNALKLSDTHRVGHAQDRAEPLAHLCFGDKEVRQQLDLRASSSRAAGFTCESMLRFAGCRVGWRARSSLGCVAATTPPASIVLSARIATATAVLGLKLTWLPPRYGLLLAGVYPLGPE
jgi:hypothetical protein